MTEGELWKEQRRFTIKQLKDVGVGKSSLEGIILDEIRDLVSDMNVICLLSQLSFQPSEPLFRVGCVPGCCGVFQRWEHHVGRRFYHFSYQYLVGYGLRYKVQEGRSADGSTYVMYERFHALQ